MGVRVALPGVKIVPVIAGAYTEIRLMIHPANIFSALAKNGTNIRIWLFCLIEANVVAGDECVLRSTIMHQTI